MNLSNIRNSLRKFFRGEETEEGRELVDRWYHFFDDVPSELIELSDREKEELRKELLADIRASAHISKTHLRHTHRRHWSARSSVVFKIAAGFIVVLLTLLPLLHYQEILAPEKQQAESVVYKTASNPAGQTSQITLADGSTVWLSAASTLQYPETFSDNQREVSLKGEAFFNVVESTEKPFIVNSEHLQTRVLGTSFNVRVFDDEEDIQVTVATGRVSVNPKAVTADSSDKSSDPIAVLSPDQQLVFNKESKTGVTQAVKTPLYTSWKDGKLIFENHSFEEITRRLERWYGVRIHFADASLKQIRFKVAFENNSLQYALRMLQIIEDFEFHMEDQQVWIKPLP